MKFLLNNGFFVFSWQNPRRILNRGIYLIPSAGVPTDKTTSHSTRQGKTSAKSLVMTKTTNFKELERCKRN